MNDKTETSWFDDVISFIKERIESPFVPSFIASWSLINIDFVLYVIFGDASKKFEVLSGWDFSGFLFGINTKCFALYWETTNSFFHPFLLAIILSVGYSSFSLFISGFRYKISSLMRAYAIKHKSNFDKVEEKIALQTDIGQLTAKKKTIQDEITTLEQNKKTLISENNELDNYAANAKKVINHTKYLVFFNFLTTSMKMYSDYCKNAEAYNLNERKIISENSLLSFVIEGPNYFQEYVDIPISDLFLISELFDANDQNLFDLLYSAIVDSKMGRYRIRDGKEFQINKILNFEPKDPS